MLGFLMLLFAVSLYLLIENKELSTTNKLLWLILIITTPVGTFLFLIRTFVIRPKKVNI